jgi:hypothetical protein
VIREVADRPNGQAGPVTDDDAARHSRSSGFDPMARLVIGYVKSNIAFFLGSQRYAAFLVSFLPLTDLTSDFDSLRGFRSACIAAFTTLGFVRATISKALAGP